ncbi:hypothetical protein ACQBAU_01895 [Propionibacteriaceae bacterium Y2011]
MIVLSLLTPVIAWVAAGLAIGLMTRGRTRLFGLIGVGVMLVGGLVNGAYLITLNSTTFGSPAHILSQVFSSLISLVGPVLLLVGAAVGSRGGRGGSYGPGGRA